MFPAAAVLALVSLQVVPPRALGDDLRGEWLVVATNSGHAHVEDLQFKTWSSYSIVSMPTDLCTPDGTQRIDARCIVDIPAGTSRVLRFGAQFPSRSGRFPIFVMGGDTVLEIDDAVFGREFPVTTDADSGPGSLRQALLDINRECPDWREPCVVTFALDESQQVIRLRTPLPEIVAPTVFVNGGQSAKVVIDGFGLVFRNLYGRVTGLVVRGSPGNGIESNAGFLAARWNELRGNALRGVQVNDGEAVVFDNILSENTRAGGFFWTQREVLVRRNRVMDNGASGLFFHKLAVSRIASYAQQNSIGGNAHAGIGLSRTAEGDFAMNTFLANRGLPIDVGLDGETRESLGGVPSQGGRVGAPILLSARFDGTNTVVTGRVAAPPERSGVQLSDRVYVHASSQPDAPGEVAAVVLGDTQQRFADLTFTVRIPRDLRGQWVRATSLASFWYNFDDIARATSELSAALPVD